MLNYADIIICLIIFISVIIGIYKGFIKELFFLASLILALILAFYLSDYPRQWLTVTTQEQSWEWLGLNIEGESIVFIISFIIIFLATFIIGNVFGSFVSRLISQMTVLKSIDRVLGGAFGMLRGILVVVLLVIFAGLTKVSIYPWWQQSHLLPPFVDGSQRIMILLPPQYSRHFDFTEPAGGEDNSMELKSLPEPNAAEQII